LCLSSARGGRCMATTYAIFKSPPKGCCDKKICTRRLARVSVKNVRFIGMGHGKNSMAMTRPSGQVQGRSVYLTRLSLSLTLSLSIFLSFSCILYYNIVIYAHRACRSREIRSNILCLRIIIIIIT